MTYYITWTVPSWRIFAFPVLAWLLLLSGCSVLPRSHKELLDSQPENELHPITITNPPLQLPSAHPAPLPPFPLQVTPEVKREFNRFLRREPGIIMTSLERRDLFFPVLAQIFQDEGLPAELLNVALLESGFRPNARSYRGAVGIWQFMSSTARMYGLRVTGRVDERLDPILSTIAAARHLRDLYNQYEDWYLALAAYNAGCGTVNRAVMTSGETNFWSIVRRGRLQRQTVEYVPRIIAASLIIKNITQNGGTKIAENFEALKESGLTLTQYS